MIDILLVAGVAFCALSVLMAIVSVARTQAPRGAALALVLGIALMFAGTWLDQRPFGVDTLSESWQRLVSGESLGNDGVTAPAPTETTPAETPAPATAGTEATPAEATPAAATPESSTPETAPATPAAGGEAPAQ